MRAEDQGAVRRLKALDSKHLTPRRVGFALGAILLLPLGLRFLNFFALYSFPVGHNDAKVVRNQIFALLLFSVCQLGGGTLLRFAFRKKIPEIDRNEDMLDRFFSILRWSLL